MLKKIISLVAFSFTMSVLAIEHCPGDTTTTISFGTKCKCRNNEAKEVTCNRQSGCDYFAMANLCKSSTKARSNKKISKE